MGIGTIEFKGNNGNASSETLGALTVANGVGRVLINPNDAISTSLTLASYTRGANAWVDFSAGESATLGGTNTIKFTTAPALSNGIIPYASLRANLATYDATHGIVSATYQATTLAGIMGTTNNVKLTTNQTLRANKTVNALVMYGPDVQNSGVDLGGYTLTISSGTLLMARSWNRMFHGTLDFGSAEGFVYAQQYNLLSCAITGTGGVSYGGDLVLNTIPTYTGPTRILGTVLADSWASDNIFPDSSTLIIDSGAVLDMGGRQNTKTEIIGSLAGAGTLHILLDDTGNVFTLAAGGDHSSTTFSGAMTGNFGFTKQGSGIFTFSGTSNNAGPVIVTEGTLRVTGNLSGSLTFVTPGGALTGTGTITGDTYVLGTYGSRLDSSGTPSAEKISVTGAVDIDGATLVLSDKAVSPAVLPGGVALTILSSTGALSGTFNGLAEGATVTVGPNDYIIHYRTSSVTLTTGDDSDGTYASWMASYDFSAFPSADLTPTGDADNDGIENAVEFVIGNEPNQALVANLPVCSLVTNPVGVPAGNYMKFAYRRTTASVDASVSSPVSYDTDLSGTWTPAVDGVNGVKIVETPNVGLPGTDVEAYIPRGANTRLFGRLSAEVPTP